MTMIFPRYFFQYNYIQLFKKSVIAYLKFEFRDLLHANEYMHAILHVYNLKKGKKEPIAKKHIV